MKPTLLSALLLLIIFSNVTAACAGRQIPVAKILSIEAPSEISPNQQFTVIVHVDYSESYSTDVAVLEATTGLVLDSRGLIIPAGRNSFAFHLTSPDQTGLWNLTATVRVWWNRGWFANENGATFAFAVMVIADSYMTSLVVRSTVTPVLVTIDGTSHPVYSEGIELIAERGLHTIEAQPLLSTVNGTRFVFDHWSDEVRSSARQIYLSDRLDLLAIYSAHYPLIVRSNLGETFGTGWYPAGADATFGVIQPIITQDLSASQLTHEFIGWSGDSHSSSPVSSVVMDGPKTLVANWSETSSQTPLMTLPIGLLSFFLLICAGTLIAAGSALRNRSRKERVTHTPIRALKIGLVLILVLCTVLQNYSYVQPVNATEATTPASVTIGKATWYHWRQARSDTLLVWLGGGIVEPTALLVNPYEFESYNTIRYIQDLSRNYDVLALKKGSLRYSDSELNRTFFREPYLSSNDFIKKIRLWSLVHEYAYLYLVGYSVGAMAAVQETVLVNPEDWTSPDGLILITTRISDRISDEATAFRASLLILYGDKIPPDFISSGQRFFENAPDEGWRDQSWVHKELHIIPDVEHEVWTIYDSGEYDDRAFLLTVGFIETCKGMQFERVLGNTSAAKLNHTLDGKSIVPFEIGIESVVAPKKVITDETFRIITNIEFSTASSCTAAIVVLDSETASLLSASKRGVNGTGDTQLVNLVISGERERYARFSLIPLFSIGDDWLVVKDQKREVTVQVTDLLSVTVVIGYSHVAVEFDGRPFETGADGSFSIDTALGEHGISVPPMIVFNNESRAVFQCWNTTASSSDLHLFVSRDICLLAVYLRQHYLDVTSPVGQPIGSGWYDENSIAEFRVEPIAVSDRKTILFVRWTGDSSDVAPASVTIMNSPKNIKGLWREVIPIEASADLPHSWLPLMTSLAILLASILFVWISLRNKRALRSRMYPCSQLASANSSFRLAEPSSGKIDETQITNRVYKP